MVDIGMKRKLVTISTSVIVNSASIANQRITMAKTNRMTCRRKTSFPIQVLYYYISFVTLMIPQICLNCFYQYMDSSTLNKRNNSFGCIIIGLPCCWGFSLRKESSSSSNRYFYAETVLPPLLKIPQPTVIVPKATTTTTTTTTKIKTKTCNQSISRCSESSTPWSNSCSRSQKEDNGGASGWGCRHCSYQTSGSYGYGEDIWTPNHCNLKCLADSNRIMPTTTTKATTASSLSSSDSLSLGLPVVYTNDPKIVSKWLAMNVPSSGCTLGFDVETVPSTAQYKFQQQKQTVHGPSVVQIATAESALVIHLARFNGKPCKACVPTLQAVLNDESIVKVGVAIDQDMLDLMDWQRCIVAKSRFDLGRLRETKRGNTPGLKTLAASILGLHLPKSRRISVSNWSTVPLSPSQLSYSARDAWVSAAIAQELQWRDPDTFSTSALVRILQSEEQSMNVLYKRHMKRKQAKILLSTILAPYNTDCTESIQKNDYNDEDDEEIIIQKQKQHNRKKDKLYSYTKYPLPGWKATIVKELKHVLNTNIHDPTDIFDVKKLGLIQQQQHHQHHHHHHKQDFSQQLQVQLQDLQSPVASVAHSVFGSGANGKNFTC